MLERKGKKIIVSNLSALFLLPPPNIAQYWLLLGSLVFRLKNLLHSSSASYICNGTPVHDFSQPNLGSFL